MAQGDLFLFNQFKENLGKGFFNLSADTVKLMISQDSGTDPTADDSDPGYSTTRTQDWTQATFEVTEFTGTYPQGGTSIGTNTWTRATTTVTFDAGDASTGWTQHANNPPDARWCCAYEDSGGATEKYGMFYVDLGSVFDMTNGDLTITWGANIFTLA